MSTYKPTKHDRVTLDTFTKAYFETAMWLGMDGRAEAEHSNDTSIDLRSEYAWIDLTEATQAEIMSDCADFQASNYESISADLSQAGHDFCLTRNGHGAGFWDGDWPAEIGRALTEASRPYGSFCLVLLDNGTIGNWN